MKRPTKPVLVNIITRTAAILEAWAKSPPQRSTQWQRAFKQQAAWMRSEAKI